MNPSQIQILKQLASDIFSPQATLLLFGSRTGDNRRGGDIDLYVTGFNESAAQQWEAKLRFLVKPSRHWESNALISYFRLRQEPIASLFIREHKEPEYHYESARLDSI